MLIRFRVANVRSLRDEQELSFVVPEGEEEGETARETSLSNGSTLAFYPALGVFGPNASGKSNVVSALKKMREAVLNSYAQWTSYRALPREAFALDQRSLTESSFFEADIVLPDGVRWTYGFELGETRVESEWLHAYPKGRRQVWLDRDASRAKEKEFDFPGDRVQDRARLARTTRPNALLLSHAATDNHPQLTPVYRWFQDNLRDITPETERAQREEFTVRQLLEDERMRRLTVELLRVADLGITGARVERLPGVRRLRARLLHATGPEDDKGTDAIDWDNESFGTRSWFALLGPVLLALDEGAVLLVDELDASLHPVMAAEVVRLFHSPHVNRHNSQLIFTAHDASLLRAPGGVRLLAPGQLWLTEKDGSGTTTLYPMSEFDPTETDDLMRSYLAGAFGAVPHVSEGQVSRTLRSVDATHAVETERS
jgi:hypothetical protein